MEGGEWRVEGGEWSEEGGVRNKKDKESGTDKTSN